MKILLNVKLAVLSLLIFCQLASSLPALAKRSLIPSISLNLITNMSDDAQSSQLDFPYSARSQKAISGVKASLESQLDSKNLNFGAQAVRLWCMGAVFPLGVMR